MSKVQFSGENGQQAGQSAPSQPENNVPAAALTPEQVEAMIEKGLSKAFRAIQSSQSKQEQRIKTFVQEQVGLLRSNNVEVTPQLEQAIANRAREQFSQSDNQDESVVPVAQPTQPKQPEPVTTPADSADDERLIANLKKQYGVEVNDDDPEVDLVETTGTWEEYEASLKLATIRKAKRLKTSPPAGNQKPVPNAAPAAGTSGLMEQYKKELAAARGVDAIYRVKAKYEKMGLNVRG